MPLGEGPARFVAKELVAGSHAGDRSRNLHRGCPAFGWRVLHVPVPGATLPAGAALRSSIRVRHPLPAAAVAVPDLAGYAAHGCIVATTRWPHCSQSSEGGRIVASRWAHCTQRSAESGPHPSTSGALVEGMTASCAIRWPSSPPPTSDQRACCDALRNKLLDSYAAVREAAMERERRGKGLDGSGGRGNKKNPTEFITEGFEKPTETRQTRAKAAGTNACYISQAASPSPAPERAHGPMRANSGRCALRVNHACV